MSIVEIAKRTGISKSTVSRALNNGSVSVKKQHLIEQAIRDMGYQIPKIRRGPKRKDHKLMIAVLFLGDDLRLLQDPETTYSPIFHSLLGMEIQEGVEIASHLFTASSLLHADLGGYSGFIILGPPPKDQVVAEALEKTLSHLPLVYIQDAVITAKFPTFLENVDRVFYENQLIGCIAGRYLLGKGYKRLAILNPYYCHPIHDVRTNSFIHTLHEHHIQAELYLNTASRSNASPVYADVDGLVERMVRGGALPEGLFVTNDIRAVHVYSALLSRGIRPMVDIDIISCDNMPFFTNQMNPRPAEIDIGLGRLGHCAINLLRQSVDKNGEEPETVLVRPKLVI